MNAIFITLSIVFTLITFGGLVFIMYNLHTINSNIDKIEKKIKHTENKMNKSKLIR